MTISYHDYTELQPIKGSLSVTRMVKNRPNSALVQRYWERRKTCPGTLFFFLPQKNPRGLPLKRAHADGNLHYQKICSAAKSSAIFIRRYKIKQ